MPQADLYVTSDRTSDVSPILTALEDAIRMADPTAGDCKVRVHQISTYLHSHVLLRLSMLPKPHRDAAFADRLGRSLIAILKPLGDADSAINVLVAFDLVHYLSAKTLD